MTGGTAITGHCPAPGPAPGPGGDRPARVSPAAGRLLGRLSVLPALLVMAWLLAGLPLLMLGRFTLPLMLAVSLPLAAALLAVGLRSIPGREGAPGRAGAPWWAVAGVIAVAAGFGAEQLIYHSEQIIVLRDPASYVQFAAWIARHGSLPIPQSRAAFGGPHLLTFASPAFYQVGGSIVPQFMAGLPMALAGAFWAGGVSAAVLVAPVLGAAAVLTFGGLAARLAGPRWALLAVLALALTLPEQYTSRASFSEPLAQILFFGGLSLVIDSLAAGGTAARVCAGLGGLALGLTILVRIDGISEILPVIPYAGLLLIRRRPQAGEPGPLRDRVPAHHAAAHDPGTGDHDAPARGGQPAGLRRLDAGRVPLTRTGRRTRWPARPSRVVLVVIATGSHRRASKHREADLACGRLCRFRCGSRSSRVLLVTALSARCVVPGGRAEGGIHPDHQWANRRPPQGWPRAPLPGPLW